MKKISKLSLGVLFSLGAMVIAGCGGGNGDSSGTTSGTTNATGFNPTTSAQPHQHDYRFDSFVWNKTVPNAWTAQAKLVCSADSDVKMVDATVTIVSQTASNCGVHGSKVYKAVYGSYQQQQTEELPYNENHVMNPETGWCYGFHQYMGATKNFDDQGYYNNVHVNLGNIGDNFNYCFRMPGKTGHKYNFEDCDVIQESDVTAFTIVDNAIKPLSLDYSVGQIAEVGSDGYIYFVVNREQGGIGAWFEIQEHHDLNEVGLCKSLTCLYEACSLFPAGGVTFNANGQKDYYYTINAFDDDEPFAVCKGHSYTSYVSSGTLDDDDYKLYKVDNTTKVATEYDGDSFFEECNGNRVYIVVTHNHVASDGVVKVTVQDHNGTHGFCPYCESPLSTELSGTPISTWLYVEDETETFWADVGAFITPDYLYKELTFASTLDIFNPENPNVRLYFYDEIEGFKLIDPQQVNPASLVYRLSEDDMGVGNYVFLEIDILAEAHPTLSLNIVNVLDL